MSDTNSSEDDYESKKKFVFYRDRPDWKDVEPIAQDDGDEPIVAIAYSEEFTDVYNYLRGIIRKHEKSERALELTKDAARLNPANYTVWQYRRDILRSLNKDIKEELKYVEQMIKVNMKNYQVWHHRKVLIEWLNDGSQELEFTRKILEEDEKNYHAWQHRQWAIKTFNLYDSEIEYVDALLDSDIRNNSAWNQRYFVMNNTSGFKDDVISQEIDYTLKKISEVTENESAWNYLRGLLLHDKEGLSKNDKIVKFCLNLYESGNRSPFLLALLVDMYDEQVSNQEGDCVTAMEKGVALCTELATKYDTIRSKYWHYMATVIERKVKKDEAAGTSSG